MNNYLKQALTFCSLVIFLLLVSANTVLAAPYGDGEYGAGLYNVGETEPDPETPAPTTSTSTSPFSEAAPAGCSDQAPGQKAPWLYAATAQNGTAILLYFTDADDPVDHYALQFGTQSGNYTWGLTDIGGKGTRTYLVESLQPNTTYYFKIRAGNGCAPGEWSNEISVKTKSAITFKQLETKDILLEPAVTTSTSQETADEQTEDNAEETELEGYTVNIKVQDENNQPVAGANVTIHSEVQESTTNEQGLATFKDVEPGEHRVLVAYDGYEGEQSLQLTGNEEEFNLAITLKKQNVLTSPLVIALIGGLSFIVVILTVLLLKKREKK